MPHKRREQVRDILTPLVAAHVIDKAAKDDKLLLVTAKCRRTGELVSVLCVSQEEMRGVERGYGYLPLAVLFTEETVGLYDFPDATETGTDIPSRPYTEDESALALIDLLTRAEVLTKPYMPAVSVPIRDALMELATAITAALEANSLED